MKAQLRLQFTTFRALAAAAAFAVLSVSSAQIAHAQSAVFDFRFTQGQTLASGYTLSSDLSTLTIAPGSGPSSVTFDVWVTIVGGSTTDASKTGLDQAKFRGFSQIVTGGGAFTTGATGGSTGTANVGPTSAVGISPLFNGHVTASGAPTQTFKDYGSSSATTTPDGIFDMGGSTSTADLGMTLGATSNAVFANNPGATPNGGSSANGGGWQFDVARVTFNLGTASATAGAKTTFLALNPITAAAAAVSIDGSTFVNLSSGTTYLPGTGLTFLIGGGGGGTNATIGLAMTTPALNDRFMQSSTYTGKLTGTVSNTAAAGANALNTAAGTNLTATLSGTGNSIGGLATGANTVTAGNSTTYTGNIVTGTGTGAQTLTVTETDAAATNSPQTKTQTINVLAPRTVTVNGAGTSAANPLLLGGGNVLANFATGVSLTGNANLATSGVDASTTRVNVATTAAADANGISGSAGTTTLFNDAGVTGTRTLSGNFTGVGTVAGSRAYTVTTAEAAATNDTTAYTPVTVFYQANVGNATADNSNSTTTFGPALTSTVAAGGTYRGLESQVVATTGAGGAGLAGGSSGLAKLMAGTNGTAGNQTPSMQWRTRTLAEKAGTTFDPSLLHPTTGIISDVLNLTGIETAGTTTAPYVLDMSYNQALLPEGGTAAVETRLAANKLIYLISLNPTTNLWEKAFADNENTGNTVGPLSPDYGVQQSWDTYAQAKFGTTSPNATQLAGIMGAWGVDTANNEVWAVLNHNSQFAVVPEPGTIVLAGMGLIGLAMLRRRSKASA